MKVPNSSANGPSSSWKITFCAGLKPRPPYSTGHTRQAQPASNFLRCHARASSSHSCSCANGWPAKRSRRDLIELVPRRVLADPRARGDAKLLVLREDRRSSSRRLQPRASRRAAAGACSSSISRSFQNAQRPGTARQRLRAAVVQVAVRLPRNAERAVHLDAAARALAKRLGRRDARDRRALAQAHRAPSTGWPRRSSSSIARGRWPPACRPACA